MYIVIFCARKVGWGERLSNIIYYVRIHFCEGRPIERQLLTQKEMKKISHCYGKDSSWIF